MFLQLPWTKHNRKILHDCMVLYSSRMCSNPNNFENVPIIFLLDLGFWITSKLGHHIVIIFLKQSWKLVASKKQTKLLSMSLAFFMCHTSWSRTKQFSVVVYSETNVGRRVGRTCGNFFSVIPVYVFLFRIICVCNIEHLFLKNCYCIGFG